MRRALRILGVIAVGALCAAAPSAASAQVELTQEATGAHCSAVTYVNHGVGSGGCGLHIANIGTIEFANPFGMLTCTIQEYSGRLDESGAGFLNAVTYAGCTVSLAPCSEAGSIDNWPFSMTSETIVTMNLCLIYMGFMNIDCTFSMDFVEGDANHSFDRLTTGPTHRNCIASGFPTGFTMQGTWAIEQDATHPELEVVD